MEIEIEKITKADQQIIKNYKNELKQEIKEIKKQPTYKGNFKNAQKNCN